MGTAVQDPAEITIPVPPGYRAYLTPRRLWADLRLVGVHVSSIALFYSVWRWDGHNKGAHREFMVYAVSTLLYVGLAFVIWRNQVARPWQYIANEKHLRVIDWQHGGRVWQWHDLVWDKEVIADVEEGEWRGLPTLIVKTAAREPIARRVYAMVYAHEDRERVVSQVLPLIQHSWKRFHHEFWCAQWEA